ncbi:unnamed protein product, partial [Pylaiella littoralis]
VGGRSGTTYGHERHAFSSVASRRSGGTYGDHGRGRSSHGRRHDSTPAPSASGKGSGGDRGEIDGDRYSGQVFAPESNGMVTSISRGGGGAVGIGTHSGHRLNTIPSDGVSGGGLGGGDEIRQEWNEGTSTRAIDSGRGRARAVPRVLSMPLFTARARRYTKPDQEARGAIRGGDGGVSRGAASAAWSPSAYEDGADSSKDVDDGMAVGEKSAAGSTPAQEQKEIEGAAAVALQAWARQRAARIRYLAEKAIRIQAVFRGLLTRVDLGREYAAAVAIQACARGFVQAMRYRAARETCRLQAQIEGSAALTLQ